MDEHRCVVVLVLGHVELRVGRQRLELTPMERTLAALLALTPGRPVQISPIIDALWPDNPPRSVRNRVQVIVSTLRRKLGAATSGSVPAVAPDGPGWPGWPAGADVIETVSRGYRLNADLVRTDLQEFEQLVTAARAMAAGGELVAAVQTYRAALSLWRGPGLDGVSTPSAFAEAARLAEARVGTHEAVVELDLALGRASEVVAELRALVAAHPLRERLRAQLMRALIDTGRQADALAAYREFRDLLARDLGLEPSPHLRQLHHDILSGPILSGPILSGPPTAPAGASHGVWPAARPAEPTRAGVGDLLPPGLEGPGYAVAAYPRGVPLPVATVCQLPPDLPGSPRLSEARALIDEITTAVARPGQPVAAVIVGPRGVGKSALAIHVAWRLLSHYTNGCLYVDLRAAARTGTAPHALVGSFLRALGVPPGAVPDDPQERVGLYRSLLVGVRVLVVLDNVGHPAPLRLLMPTGSGCAALLTSRDGAVAALGTVTMTLAPHEPTARLNLKTAP